MSYETQDFDPWDPIMRTASDEADETAVKWTLYEKGSPSEHYLQVMGDRLAEHTGSRTTYLTAEQEHELAAVIQDGLAAAALLEELEKKVEVAKRPLKRDLQQLDALRARFDAGREAERVLIECNLRNATYLARLSMNIRPGMGRVPDETDDAGVKPRKQPRSTKMHIQGSDYSWAPGDMTRLRSPYADYDERVQVVNEAIVKAVRNFKPGMVHTRGDNIGKPVRFRSYAINGLRGALAKHVKAYEKPGLYIPINRVEEMQSAMYDPDNDAGRTPEELANFQEWDKYRDPIFIDHLVSFGAADEEIEVDGEVSALALEEVVADTDTASIEDIVMERMRVDVIAEALGTLSEREAGVIRLRFGLTDGVERTLDEVGMVYGITRERVRQILTKTLDKLRHPARSRNLEPFLNLDVSVEAPVHTRTFPVLKTERVLGARAIRLGRDAPLGYEPPASGLAEPRARWQAYPGEAWDEPVRITPEQVLIEYEATAARFKDILYTTGAYSFQQSFVEAGHASEYPKVLVEALQSQMGEALTVRHIAGFWNAEVENFVTHLQERMGDISLDRVGQLFSRLLAERMNDNTFVELTIPESLQGKLGYMGAGLEHGELVIHGNLGDYAGYKIGGLALVKVNGSVGNYAAAKANKMARLEVMGDAGHYAAAQARNQASLHVYGAVGDYCGYQARKDIDVQVLEDAGEHVAHEATGGSFIISGTALSSSPAGDFSGTISARLNKR
ncbi:MAG TPA: sigma-70 family RNA polymerase sigma factor [Candidatus Saccharimonadales bacterium]|nr:sigma-70 family RNA polymerase sigma factor [Candidatus Saccharimonadales bacterium]